MLESLFVVAPLVLASVQAPQVDPFAPHVRWTEGSVSTAAWLPSSLEFAAHGELLLAGAQGAHPRVELQSTATLAGMTSLPPLYSNAFAGAYGPVLVASGGDERELFTATQYVGVDALHRRTEIARYDVRASTAGPLWTRNLGLIGNGAAKLAASRDGTRVLGAAHDAQFQVLDLEWFDAATGQLLASKAGWAQTLRAFSAASDLSRVAVVVGAELRVYTDNGALEHAEVLPSASNALALSADGTTIAVGAGSKLRLLRRSGAVWSFAGELTVPTGEVATRAALSNVGETLAVGWWDSVGTKNVRLQVWNLATSSLAFEQVVGNASSTLQNFVEAVALTPDGRRAAFGCWGQGDSLPEVLLADRDSGALVQSYDLPGSVRALALDATGTRIAVGFKHVHANQLGSTGEVRLFDTGERDLQLVTQPFAGASLDFVAREPGAPRIFFLLGQGLGSPIDFGASVGELWVDRSSSKRYVRPTDASGTAHLSLPLSPLAAGLEWTVQTVVRTPSGLRFSSARVEPVIF